MRKKDSTHYLKLVLHIDRIKVITAEKELKDILASYNKEITKLGSKIAAIKKSGVTSDVTKLENELNEINTIEQRFSTIGAQFHNALRGADELISKLEKDKEKENAALIGHNDAVANNYLTKVNELLINFGCRFSIKAPETMSKKGHAPVIDLGFSLLGKDFDSKRFGDLLSESDKRALAFAFFIAQLYSNETDLKNMIVVIDDPFTSLDDNRISATHYQIKSLEPDVKQIIVLSHYRVPMSELASDFPEALKLEIKNDSTNGSKIIKTGLYNLRHNEHEKRLERLEFIEENNIDDSEIPEVKKIIREILEHEIGSRFRPSLKKVEAKTLGGKITAIEKSCSENILSFKGDPKDVIRELRHINKIVSPEHHADGKSEPYEDNLENLRGLIDMTLKLIYLKL